MLTDLYKEYPIFGKSYQEFERKIFQKVDFYKLISLKNQYIDLILANCEYLPLDLYNQLKEYDDECINANLYFNNRYYKWSINNFLYTFYQDKNPINPDVFNIINTIKNLDYELQQDFLKICAVNPNIDSCLCEWIINYSPNKDLLFLISRNPACGEKHQQLLLNLLDVENYFFLALNKNITYHTTNYLFFLKNSHILECLAINENLSDFYYNLLIKIELDGVNKGLLVNPRIPINIKKQIIKKYPNLYNWYRLYNDDSSMDEKDFLVDSKLAEILIHKTKNSNVITNIYKYFNNNSVIVKRICINEYTDASVLEDILYETNDPDIIKIIAISKNITYKMVEYIILIENKECISLLSKNKNLNEESLELIHNFYKNHNENLFVYFLEHPNLNSKIIEHYHKKSQIEYDNFLSRNKNLPDCYALGLIEKYKNSDGKQILVGLSKNTQSPMVIIYLFGLNKEYLYINIAKNINTPSQLLSVLPEKYKQFAINNPNYKKLSDTLKDFFYNN